MTVLYQKPLILLPFTPVSHQFPLSTPVHLHLAQTRAPTESILVSHNFYVFTFQISKAWAKKLVKLLDLPQEVFNQI